jgi:LruC domain-containing protein
MVRSHEIHLPDYAPTDLMDLNLFKTRDDASNPPATWYKSFDNLPWGLNFPSKFDYTYEKDTLWEGHLKFINWVNAKGATYTDWFQNEPGFRDPDKIYTPSK